MSGEAMNYKFGQKNHWRRTIWNAISDRLQVPAKDAVVLYLGGKTDLDRQIALSKGFRPENMLFIDRSKKVVDGQRGAGHLAIAADFFQAVHSLPRSLEASVVFGDFCSGMSPDTLDKVCGSLWLKNTHAAVFAFNFLRGRDPSWCQWSNAARDLWGSPSGGTKHRGRQLIDWVLLTLTLQTHPWFEYDDRNDGWGFSSKAPRQFKTGQLGEVIGRYVKPITQVMRPQIFDYRSVSRQTFDSVVFVNPVKLYAAKLLADVWRDPPVDVAPGTRSRLAAVAAHRTMRRKRVGPYARS